jgi:hypothetical protein
LDALHLSIWMKKVAMIVDPGTGAYHADRNLRTWLASRPAHNAPCPMGVEHPRRAGPFLWEGHHAAPRIQFSGELAVATLELPGATLRRSVRRLPTGDGWEVGDACETPAGLAGGFRVRWQFAPGSWVKRLGARKFCVHRADVEVNIEVGDEWNEVELVEPVTPAAREVPIPVAAGLENMEGIVSPAFRQVCQAPFLKLTARGDQPCVFTTTFLASAHS